MTNKNSEGFTLLELVIYTGIFSLVGGLLTGFLFTSTKVGVKEGATTEVAGELDFVMQTIQRLVRDSSTIIVNDNALTAVPQNFSKDGVNGNGGVGIPLQYLVLRMKDPTLDPTIIWKDTNGFAKVQQGPSGQPADITTKKVVVDQLKFSKFTNYPAHDSVAVDLQISYSTTNPQEQVTRSLKGAISRVSAATFDDKVIPGTDATHDLGISSAKWKDAFISGTLEGGGVRLTNLLNCGGASVLETDALGNITCGADAGAAGSGITTVSNADGTITITNPDANTAVVSLNLNKANNWTGVQTFSGTAPGAVFSNGASFPGNGIWNTSGNVGIGTAGPNYKLDISGGNIRDLSTNPNLLLEDSDSVSSYNRQYIIGRDGYLLTQAYDGVSFISTMQLFPTYAYFPNNIGVKTSSPAYALDVLGAMRLQPTGAPVTPANGNIYYDSGTNKFRCYESGAWKDCIGSGGIAGTPNYLPLFSTAATLGDSVIAQSGTNIGIGTASPVSKLHVNDTNNTVFAPSVTLSRGSSAGNKLGILGLGSTDWTLSTDSAGHAYMSRYAVWDLAQGRWESNYTGSAVGPELVSFEYDGDILFQTISPAALNVGDSLTFNNTLMLKGNGYVGLGNTTPAELLHLGANASASDFAIQLGGYSSIGQLNSSASTIIGNNVKPANAPTNGMEIITAHASYGGRAIKMNSSEGITFHGTTGAVSAGAAFSNELMRINNSGNVGIGTNAPANLLHLNKNGLTDQTYITITNGTTGSTASDGLTLGYDGIGNRAIVWNREATRLDLATNNAAQLSIDAAGNVGIGTTGPGYKLDVLGAMRLQPTGAPVTPANGNIYYDSGTNKFRCYESGAWKDCIGSGGIAGNGTASYVPLWATGTSLGDSAITQVGTNIGVGSGAATDATLDVLADSATEITAQFRPAVGATADVLQILGSGGTVLASFQADGDFAVDSNVLFVDALNNRVGIGTVAPSQNLHVVGNARVTGLVSCDTIDTNISGDLVCGTDAGGTVGPGTANKIAKFTGTGSTVGNSIITDDSTNLRIGVNQGTPVSTLDVGGTITSTGLVVNSLPVTLPSNSIDSTEITDLTIVNADIAAAANIQATKTDGYFATKNIITSTGKIGLGNTPTAYIEILPQNGADADIFFNDLGNTRGFALGIDDTDGLFKINTAIGSLPAPYLGDFTQFVMDASGNVGLGVQPINRLDVKGGVAIGTNYAATWIAPSNGALIEGDVGLNTQNNGTIYYNSPQARLHSVVNDQLNIKPAILAEGLEDVFKVYKFGDDVVNGTPIFAVRDNGTVGINTLPAIPDALKIGSGEVNFINVSSTKFPNNTKIDSAGTITIGSGLNATTQVVITSGSPTYSPLSINNVTALKFTCTTCGTSTVNGILPTTGLTDGKILYLYVTGGNVTLAHNVAGSGKILTPTLMNIPIAAYGGAVLIYDANLTGWVVMSYSL